MSDARTEIDLIPDGSASLPSGSDPILPPLPDLASEAPILPPLPDLASEQQAAVLAVHEPPTALGPQEQTRLLRDVREFMALPADVLELLAKELCAAMSQYEREILLVRLVVLAERLR
jgi:hypothetical protein